MAVKVVRFDSVTYTISITNDQWADLQDIVYRTGVKHSVLIEGILLDGIKTGKEYTEKGQANGKAERAENRKG